MSNNNGIIGRKIRIISEAFKPDNNFASRLRGVGAVQDVGYEVLGYGNGLLLINVGENLIEIYPKYVVLD